MDTEKLNDLLFEREYLFSMLNEPIRVRERRRILNRLTKVLTESKRLLREEALAIDARESQLISLGLPQATEIGALRHRQPRPAKVSSAIE
jgi:hypothetical protein